MGHAELHRTEKRKSRDLLTRVSYLSKLLHCSTYPWRSPDLPRLPVVSHKTSQTNNGTYYLKSALSFCYNVCRWLKRVCVEMEDIKRRDEKLDWTGGEDTCPLEVIRKCRCEWTWLEGMAPGSIVVNGPWGWQVWSLRDLCYCLVFPPRIYRDQHGSAKNFRMFTWDRRVIIHRKQVQLDMCVDALALWPLNLNFKLDSESLPSNVYCSYVLLNDCYIWHGFPAQ